MPDANRPRSRASTPARGQILVLFALALTAIILSVGLIIDGGNALTQRRGAQNAADFAAMAGARIVAEWIGGDTTNGTDTNVQAAITNAAIANGGAPVVFGQPGSPQYVDKNGGMVGYVGGGTSLIPAGSVGVTVNANRSWRPYFLGLIGAANWTASANATALGGFCQSCTPPPGT